MAWMTWVVLLTLAVCSSFVLTAWASDSDHPLSGVWNATIDIPGQPLDMSFQFTYGDTLTGSVDIPVQGAFGLRLAEIELETDDVRFAFADIPAYVIGTLSSDNTVMEGSFHQAGMEFPLRAEKVTDKPSSPVDTESDSSPNSQSDSPQVTELDDELITDLKQRIETAMHDWDVPGLSVAIVQDGDIVFAEGFGLRDVENSLPVTPNTLFGIGSTTKSFTTAAFQMLVDEGLLSWEQPIREVIPGFRLSDLLVTERITALDFALHRSGLPRHDIPWMFNPDLDADAFISAAEHLSPVADFRTAWIYNNFGYVVLGKMMEEATGEPWETIITERLLQPLHMNETRLSIAAMQSSDDFSHAYSFEDGEFERIDLWELGAAAPAGAINSSAMDMARWLLLHLENGRIGDEELVSNLGMHLMHMPQIVMPGGEHPEINFTGYGPGWMVDSYRGHYRVHHGGNTIGFSANAAFLPDEKIGVVVLANGLFTLLPNIVTNDVLDMMLGLEPIDWSGHYKMIAQAQEAALAEVGGDLGKKQGTMPSHDLEEYTGVYAHPAYGEVEITLVDEALEARYYVTRIPLEHWHFDQFRGTLHKFAPLSVPFFFLTDAAGDVSQVNIGFEQTVEPIPFTRRPSTELQNELYLRQFVGEYEFMGATFTVTLRDNVLTLHVPGQPPYPLVPMREGQFVFRDHDGFGVNFSFDDDGNIDKALLIQPHGNIELNKKDE